VSGRRRTAAEHRRASVLLQLVVHAVYAGTVSADRAAGRRHARLGRTEEGSRKVAIFEAVKRGLTAENVEQRFHV